MSDPFSKAVNIGKKIVNKVMGKTVTYNLIPELTSVTIKGIFSNAYIDVNGVTTTQPILRINGDDLSRRPSIKDTITFDSKTYRIREVQDEDNDINAYTLLIKDSQ